MIDPRTELKRADALLKNGDVAGAVAAYATVAREYESQGFMLKAIALWKQIREVVAATPQQHAPIAVEARRSLITLFRKLGLDHDAAAIEAEPTILH